MAVAIACVAAALLLYVAGALVFDFDEDTDEGALMSMRGPPPGRASE